MTLIAFAVAALALFVFASSLSWRLRRLRDEAENAIDSQGRVRGLVAGEHARDEIGDLSRSFSTVLFGQSWGWEQLWVFIVFPIIGGVIGALIWRFVTTVEDET